MYEYDTISLEELRFEDYLMKRKFPQERSGFGSTYKGYFNKESLLGSQSKPTTTLFGQTTTIFGNTSLFFNKPLFGDKSTTTFGDTEGLSGFGSTIAISPFRFTSAQPKSAFVGFGVSDLKILIRKTSRFNC
jgi:hypothetical protein